MINIEKMAKENGFVTHLADDGECYADYDTLKDFAEAYHKAVCKVEASSTSENSNVLLEKCEPNVELSAQLVIDFIGSNYNSMRTHDEQGNELSLDDITYSLTVHDLLSAFSYTTINPVAYRYKEDGYWVYTKIHKDKFNCQALYTSPQPKEWIGLSDEDIICCYHSDPKQHLRNIEAKLKELNT